MSVVLNAHDLEGKEEAIISDLMEATEPDSINVERDIALIAIVGRGMKNVRGTAASVFMALAENNINIKMIATSEIRITVIIEESEADRAVKAVHDKFALGE